MRRSLRSSERGLKLDVLPWLDAGLLSLRLPERGLRLQTRCQVQMNQILTKYE